MVPLKLVFVTRGLSFSGNSLEHQSLGGSETALLQMARALAKRGHEVVVFCECSEMGAFDGVLYLHQNGLEDYLASTAPDVLIASRWPEFLTLPHPAGLRVLWLHDMPRQKDPHFLGSLFQTDLVFTLSQFHSNAYLNELPELGRLLVKTRNGLDLDYVRSFKRPLVQKIPGRLIYTSRPERGLLHLYKEIFPRLLEQRPDLTLDIAGYSIDGLRLSEEAKALGNFARSFERSFPGKVRNLGALRKEDLYHAIAESELLLYPTHFPEISCITALEAQALGTPIVSTKDFALTESVGPHSGILVEGTPGTEAYTKAFVEETLSLLGDPERRKNMANAGQSFLSDLGHDWDIIASEWETLFYRHFEERWRKRRTGILQNLVRHGDLLSAENLGFDAATAYYLTEQARDVDLRVDPAETLRGRFRAALPRFQDVLKRLEDLQVAPKSLLDLASGDAAFGILYKTKYPETDVICIDANEEVCERLAGYANENNVGLVVGLGDIEVNPIMESSGLFDCIFLGDKLETSPDPIRLLQSMFNALSKDGHLVLTTRYGPQAVLYKDLQPTSKLINFSPYDFEDILKENYSVSFFQDGVNESGEAYGHWTIIAPWRDPESLGELNFERRKFARPYESLTFTMIVKDEEDHISRCLKSVQGIADAIHVVDTGSTDKTIEIAKGLGARIFDVVFEDFAQARNYGLMQAHSDWILWLDADEVLLHPERLRSYLSGPFFEAYIIRQNHLILDSRSEPDLPVRLFRNKTHYRFTGCIHEHVEDTSIAPYDIQLSPVVALSDVDIVHYGYLDEMSRRIKCSSRNMALLRKDLKENPDRLLNKILAQRDFLNIAKWRLGNGHQMRKIQDGSLEQSLVSFAVGVFFKYMTDPTHRYYPISFKLYQEALNLLGQSNVPVLGYPQPPFQLEILLRGSIGPLSRDDIRPEKRWFIDPRQVNAYLYESGKSLVDQLDLGSAETPMASWFSEEGILEMLGHGVDVYQQGEK